MKKPRINKTKPQITQDIKAIQEADRLRKMVREQVYPFLVSLNDTIGFTKIFLQVCSVSADTAFNNLSKDMKVSELIPKLSEVFKDKTPENQKYMDFFEMFKDESLSTFTSLTETMPRMIEKYFTQDVDKRPIIDLPIEKVLG